MKQIIIFFFGFSYFSSFSQETNCVPQSSKQNSPKICWGTWTAHSGIYVSVRGPRENASNTIDDSKSITFSWSVKFRVLGANALSFDFTAIDKNGRTTKVRTTAFPNNEKALHFQDIETFSSVYKINVYITNVEELTRKKPAVVHGVVFDGDTPWYSKEEGKTKKEEIENAGNNNDNRNKTVSNKSNGNSGEKRLDNNQASSNTTQLSKEQIKEKILENLRIYSGGILTGKGYYQVDTLKLESAIFDNGNLILNYTDAMYTVHLLTKYHIQFKELNSFKLTNIYLGEARPDFFLTATTSEIRAKVIVSRHPTFPIGSEIRVDYGMGLLYNAGPNNANYNELMRLIGQLQGNSTENLQQPTKETIEKAKVEKQKAEGAVKQPQEIERQQKETLSQQEVVRKTQEVKGQPVVAKQQQEAKRQMEDKAKTREQNVISEGMVSYTLSATNGNTVLDAFNGATLTVWMKSSDVRSDFKSIMRTQSIFYNANDNSAIVLKEMGAEKYMENLTPAHWKHYNRKYDAVTFTFETDTKTIAGYKCKKAIGKMKDGDKIVVYYTTSLVPLSLGYDYVFKDLPGLPLEYEIASGTSIIKYTASKVQLAPVSDSIFELPTTGYKMLDYKQ